MGDRAVIGLGGPLATARDGEAEWLAPDWQGTLGGPRDPFGAPARSGLALGYRGELEFAGLTWLRARAYDPSTRGFLSPDPLPPVLGTAYAANPYHYAGNDPLNRIDPLGLRPVTDQELRDIRDRMGSNFLSRNKDWIIAGALIGLPALLLAAWTVIALSYTYSRGDRAGYIQKLSKKGWLCKTWEGELAMVNIPGAMQERFPFTVRSDSLAAVMTRDMGSQVSLTYEEHRGVPGSCFGETNYYVTSVRPVGK